MTVPDANATFDSTREYSGSITLSRPDKTVNPSRRDFLIRCCQGASAALFPASLRGFTLQNAPPPTGEFHLRPHYRSQTPLDATLLKTQAGLDDFITEKYADDISAIFSEWTTALLQTPQDVKAIEKVLAANFSGVSLRPTASRIARPGPAVQVRQNQFALEPSLGQAAFLQELRTTMSAFTKIVTAEFQVTSITASPNALQTRVRYDLVGTGRDVYRQQRVGYWDLAWDTAPSGGFRLRSWQSLDETQSQSASRVFADITAQAFAGVSSYSSQLSHGTDYWRTVLDGASGIDIYGHNGVSVGDIDDDGFDDLYVCQPAGLPNRLYRNRGDGTFEDITEASGVGILENTACALFADIDNDGHQDLIVVRANGPLLFLNQGGGKFRPKPDAFKFATPPQGTFTGAAMADYDRDGWLDIYFCLYVYYQGADQYKYPSPYFDAKNGPSNFMMRNNRDATFRDVTAETGLDQNNTRYSFCCGWSDYNRDGWPDLYVVNDFGRKNLYHNNGDGTFTDVAAKMGVEDIGAGMSVCWLDYDDDNAEDLYVANMWTAAGERITMQDNFKKDASDQVRARYRKHAMGNTLFHNGDSTFQNTTEDAGAGMGRWSWSSDAWDFDHDGYPDLYITNGMVSGTSREDLNSFFWRQVVAYSPEQAKASHDYEQGWTAINELIRADHTWSGFERNVFYANNRDGTFSDVSGSVGMDFLEDGRAFAIADFDHDGRQEIFLKNRNAPQLRLMKNVIKDLAPAITFRLRGSQSNRDAIGAAITVDTENGRQTLFVQAGSGFLSQHSKEVFFGLGQVRGPVRVSVRWPSGLEQNLHELPVNHRIWVTEGSEPSRIEPFKTRAAKAPDPAISKPQAPEQIPTTTETWLLAPVAAPDFSLPDLTGQARTLASLRGKPVLLTFWTAHSPGSQQDLQLFNKYHATWASKGLQLLAINVDDASDPEVQSSAGKLSFPNLRASDDVAGIYNILYRYVYDRRRDLTLPTSFLINDKGDIVKIYQGPVNPEHLEQDFQHIPQTTPDRIARALPFPGITDTQEFGRNYLSYGSVFFQRGYFDQAEVSFRRALSEDPSSAEALYGLGSVYLNNGKTAEARDCFDRATKLHSSYPDTLPNAWNNLGLIAAREGRPTEAIEYFQESLRLSPDHVIALDNLGSVYRQLKQWDQARKTFAQALAINPTDPEANYGLGMVFAQNNDTAKAEQYLRSALQSRPTYPEALNNLGILYLRTERRDQAVATFEECIRVAPSFDQSYLNLARVYTIEGAPDKARAILQSLLKQNSTNPQAQQMLNQLPH